MYIIKKEINSINEYIEFICNYQNEAGTELWYRGQGDNRWKLDSTLNREKKRDISTLCSDEIDILKYKNIPDFKFELN